MSDWRIAIASSLFLWATGFAWGTFVGAGHATWPMAAGVIVGGLGLVYILLRTPRP